MTSIDLTTFCVICKDAIPENRAAKRAFTCEKKDCKKQLKLIRRTRTNMRRCKICGKPSTPEERKAFLRWRKSDPEFKTPGRGRPKNK